MANFRSTAAGAVTPCIRLGNAKPGIDPDAGIGA